MGIRKVSVLFYESRDGETTSHDEVVEQVVQALTAGGHQVSFLGINSDISELIKKLEDQKPDIVFNLCETFAGKDASEMHITAILELLGVRFTGTGPPGMVLRQDKALTKKLLKFYDVNCSSYAVFDKKHLEFAGRMRFPLFIKPLHGDASTRLRLCLSLRWISLNFRLDTPVSTATRPSSRWEPFSMTEPIPLSGWIFCLKSAHA
jgi:D-alanine-D-alanine ligase